MIYVTHDQVEAMTLADKIVVLRDGKVEQVGSPTELYDFPHNVFVAEFIGSPKMNFFKNEDLCSYARDKLDDDFFLGVRPEHLISCEAESAWLKGKLELVENLGEYLLIHLSIDTGTSFIVKLPRGFDESTKEIFFKPLESKVHFFNILTGLRRKR